MSAPGALMALGAQSAQDQYVWGTSSHWTPQQYTHTPFALTQNFQTFQSVNGYLGQKMRVEIIPGNVPDLLTNIYLAFTLPNTHEFPDGVIENIVYISNVGRAIFYQVSLIIDNTYVETLTDDWYTLRDELFLTQDQKNAMTKVLNNGPDYIVPLDLFFCHRKNSPNPYLPMCALTNSRIFLEFQFQPAGWISPNTDFVLDLENPYLIIEGVTLGPEEKLYYMSTPLDITVPIAQKEAVGQYQDNRVVTHLSANFPVAMLVWFIRNRLYETYDPRFYADRYSYGYTTQYIASPVDTVQEVTMYFNNQNVLSTFPNGVYHSTVQPFEHGLTVPQKNIYMYSFTDNPRKYQTDGVVDFSKYDYSTTHIDVTFYPQYITDVENNFSFNLYYFGFQVLHVENGIGSFSKV